MKTCYRKLGAKEKANRYHLAIIDDGGSYGPESNRYYNSAGLIMPLVIKVGPDMAIRGIVPMHI